jgi:hypothetical protein
MKAVFNDIKKLNKKRKAEDENHPGEPGKYVKDGARLQAVPARSLCVLACVSVHL